MLISEQLILRRVVTQGVVMATLHPIIGPLYWTYCDQSECNAPDGYGLTTDIDLAHVFNRFYEQYEMRAAFLENWTNDLEWDHLYDENGNEISVINDWQTVELAKLAKTKPEAFVDWVHDTEWVEYPAPYKIWFLEDFNGFVGYRPQWTNDPKKALKFSLSEIDEDGLDVMLAKRLGRFVPALSAMSDLPKSKSDISTNHPLEAHCNYVLHKLKIGKSSFDHLECARAHAAHAGRLSARGPLRVSPHIAACPELLEVYRMRAALATYQSIEVSTCYALPKITQTYSVINIVSIDEFWKHSNSFDIRRKS